MPNFFGTNAHKFLFQMLQKGGDWYAATHPLDCNLLLARASGRWTLTTAVSRSGYSQTQTFICALIPIPEGLTLQSREDTPEEIMKETLAKFVKVEVYDHSSPDERDCGMMVNLYFAQTYDELIT